MPGRMSKNEEPKSQGGRLEFLPMESPPPAYHASFPSALSQASTSQPIQSQPSMTSLAGPPQPVAVTSPQRQQQMYATNPTMIYQPSMPMTHTNTVVVTQASSCRTVVIQKKPKMQHWLHCLITLFFPPWLCVWIALCILHSRKKDKRIEV